MAGAIGAVFGSGALGSVFGGSLGGVFNSLSSIFGKDNILGAIANNFLAAFGDGLKSFIDSAPIPDILKDAAKSLVDGVVEMTKQDVPADAQEAVDESEFGEMAMKAGMEAAEEAGEEANKKASGKDGGSGENWLVALAKSLANMQAGHLNSAMENRDIMEANSGDSPEERTAFLQAQSEFGADMKLFGMTAEATSNALKSLGEGLQSIARKQ